MNNLKKTESKTNDKNMKLLLEKIIKKTREYFKENLFEKAVLGLSGGIDSALTLFIMVKVLGSENITVLLMPEKGLTKKENITDAIKLAESLKVKYFIIPINPFIRELKNTPIQPDDFALAQFKPRIRMALLYFYANANNALVVGTGNKSELMTGYFTKYGDGANDLLPLGNVYKTDVFKLAKIAGLPEKIIRKKPSAELLKNQEDEKDLGLTYNELDEILKEFEITKSFDNLKGRFDDVILSRIKVLHETSKHKRMLPFIIKV